MAIDVLMPALSPTMEEGTLAKWLVQPGDRVAAGDVIAEIETDKATMEVEAADDGTVEAILVPAGTEGVKVNAVIARLGGGDPAPAKGAARPARKGAEAGASSPLEGEEDPSTGATKRGDGTASKSAGAAAKGAGHRVIASPLARRLASDAGIDLSFITGTGPGGRVVKGDIEAAKNAGAARSGPASPIPPGSSGGGAAGPAPAPMSDGQILAIYPDGSYERKPHDSLRKIIARRLTEAKQTIPHIYLTVDTEIDALSELRHEINLAAPEGPDGKPVWRVSINDMVIRALAMSLRDVPDANVTWTEGGMLHHRHADVGVAVAITGGLITPVVRNADTKALSEISNEMKDLAARARARRLLPAEYQGGSTSVSNLGMYGTREFAAVINPPQSTILAVGAGTERAVVHSGSIEIATVMTVTLSADHRAVDGAIAAELLRAFRRHIEKPAGMLV